MAVSKLYQPASPTLTCVSSGSSLANGAAVAANGASNLTNSTLLAPYVSARLYGGFGAAPTAGNVLSLYLAPILDGTNGADVDVSTPYCPSSLWVGNFVVAKSQTGTQRMDIPFIPLVAYDYIAYILNQSGQTLSSGWTLTFSQTDYQY